MKKFIIGILIILILIIAVTINLLYQHHILNGMLESIASMDDHPSQRNSFIAKKLVSTWDDHDHFFTLTTHLREIDNVSLALSKLETLSLDGDIHQFILSRREAELYIRSIKDGDTLSLFGVL